MKYLSVQMGLGGLLRAQMSQGTSIKTTGQEVSKVLSTRTVRPSHQKHLYLYGRLTGWLNCFFLNPAQFQQNLRQWGFNFICYKFILFPVQSKWNTLSLGCYVSCVSYVHITHRTQHHSEFRDFPRLTVVRTTQGSFWNPGKPGWVPCLCETKQLLSQG